MTRPRLRLLMILSATVAACSASHPVAPRDAARDQPTPMDGTSPDGASADQACVPAGIICSTIVRCAPCDGGLCGPVSNLDGCDQSNLTCVHGSTTPDAGICAVSCGAEGLPCCADDSCGALSIVLCVHDSASSATGTCRSCGVIDGPCCPGTIPSRACGIHGLVCDTSAGPEGRCVAGPSDAGSETGD
jgi:hypothetical protein